jgi:hypothetical protein
MNRFLKHWRLSGCGEAFRAHVVSYADDFVILSRGRATEALAWTKAVMTKLGLSLNEVKTSLKDARQERFSFLGYSFGPHWFKANRKWYLSASPSKKSMQRLKTKVGDLLVPGNIAPWQEIRDKLNRLLRGWSNYSGRVGRHSAQLIATPTSVCATSSQDGTRWQGVAPSGSRVKWSTRSSACCASNACHSLLGRVPRGEASRRAGCGNSARPVRERGSETGRWPLAPSYRAHPRLYQGTSVCAPHVSVRYLRCFCRANELTACSG